MTAKQRIPIADVEGKQDDYEMMLLEIFVENSVRPISRFIVVEY